MREKLLYNLNEIPLVDKKFVGGKALGLVQSLEFVEELQNFGMDVSVPKTFVLSSDGHQEYLKENRVPNRALVAAVKAMHASGGVVAVRSSADVEDGSDKSYSGKFESVLNVSGVEEMRQALQKVYQSAENVVLENGKMPKMSVVIQQMISNPDYAGVAYSQDFDGDPFVVINRTKGKTAEKLVQAEEEGEIIKISKYIRKDAFRDKGIGVLSPDAYNDFNSRYHFVSLRLNYKGEQIHAWAYKKAIDDRFGKEVLPLVAAINHLEAKQGHPIDMEFATKNGRIYILQQRPYLMKQNFVVKTLSNGDIVGYNADSPIICSEMIDFNSPVFEQKYNKEAKMFDLSGYIYCSVPCAPSRNEWVLNAKHFAYYGDLKADLIVDNYGYMRTSLYGHHGNLFREKGQPFWISARGDALRGIKAGEKVRIDLSRGVANRILLNRKENNGR